MEVVAKQVYALLASHLDKDDLEVEMRFTLPWAQRVASEEGPPMVPVLLSGHPPAPVQVGVSRDDFTIMQAFVRSQKAQPHAPVVETITTDVNIKNVTYTFSSSVPRETAELKRAMKKHRVFVKDFVVPGSPYNLRLSVSTETILPLPPSGRLPNGAGYKRTKNRMSVQDGLCRYDLTSVDAPGKTTYEVEVEGCFTDIRAQLNEAWVMDIFHRMMQLAQLPGVKGVYVRK